MESPSQSSDPNARAIAEVLEKMWARYLPDILERVGTLQEASAALTSGSLSPAASKAAESAAHKLAGTLGTFALPRGTELARELEQTFAAEGGPEPASASWIATTVSELRTMIESRPSNS
jgi:HPt (histidine-containing phosphotransfer) domain-containing protein